MIKTLSITLLAVVLTGCSTFPSAQQPRALGLGNIMPTCAFLCFQTNTQSDAEAGAKQSNTSTSNQTATVSNQSSTAPKDK